MSRLVVVFLLLVGLVIAACATGPEAPRRCCADPAHRLAPESGEMSYCPTRDG